MESKNINHAREQLANTEGMPWFSVYLFSFVLVFFVLVGFVCFYLGVGCLKERKYMRLGGLGGKEDLEGDRALERI